MAALRAAHLFVMIYPGKIVTSALVEVGYAMALRLPCLLLVRDRDDLPYLLKQAERAGEAAQLPPIEIQTLGGRRLGRDNRAFPRPDEGAPQR